MDWKKHIDVNADVVVGKPIIRGTRISVELLLDRLADGWSTEDILLSYPNLTRADVLAAIGFVAELFNEKQFTAVNKLTT